MERSHIVGATLVLAACATQSSPVPVGGDVSALVGEWRGSYESTETGRSGSIVFTLAADADTAWGDVIMIPRGSRNPLQRAPAVSGGERQRLVSEVLTIRLVRVVGGRVQGVLDPYRDPDCGCIVNTSFDGRLAGDRIEGTFQTRHPESGRVVSGRWSVIRESR